MTLMFGTFRQKFHEKQLKQLQLALDDKHDKLSVSSTNPLALADISKDNIQRRSTTRESGPDID